MLKNKKKCIKWRCIKTMRMLVEQQNVTVINLYPTAKWFLPVFTETAPEVEKKDNIMVKFKN